VTGRSVLLLILLAVPAANAAPLEVFQDCNECPEMIALTKGSFTMGARPNAEQRAFLASDGWKKIYRKDKGGYTRFSELPMHRVVVDIPFALSRNEITYNEWMRDGGCGDYTPPDRYLIDEGPFIGGDHPVTRVSFEDAKAYAAWLNHKTGTEAYRLPTEAEWEYAARAGTETRYAQGDTISPAQANFSGSWTEFTMLQKIPGLVDRGKPVPVTMLDAANGWGLRHMSGNVKEWTLSCFTKEGYEGWPRTSIWLENADATCVKQTVRGGEYLSPTNTIRVAHRGRAPRRRRLTSTGFRILRELVK